MRGCSTQRRECTQEWLGAGEKKRTYHDELQRLLRWAVWRQRMQRTTVTDPCFDMISSFRSLSVSNVYRDPCEKPDRCTLLSLYAVA